MKKEHIAAIILGLFLLGYIFDYVSGPVNIVLKSPFDYINPDLLSRYPFTTVSIIIKTIALFSTFMLLLSFFQKKLLEKGIGLLFVAAMFILYSIQQLATGLNLIPIQWTMALTWTGILLIPPSIILIILGIIFLIIDKTFKNEVE